jgi:hypothetical protein
MARPVFNRQGKRVPGMYQAGGNTPRQQNIPGQKQQRQVYNTDALAQVKNDLAKDTANFERFQRENQFDASMPMNHPSQGTMDPRMQQQAQSYIQGMKDQKSLIETVEAAMRQNIELQKQMRVMQAEGNLGKTKFDVINERNRILEADEMNPPSNKKMTPSDMRKIKDKAESLRRGGFIKMKYN